MLSNNNNNLKGKKDSALKSESDIIQRYKFLLLQRHKLENRGYKDNSILCFQSRHEKLKKINQRIDYIKQRYGVQ
jgi:hypothetical protein